MSVHWLIVESPAVGNELVVQVMPFKEYAAAFRLVATATNLSLPYTTDDQFLDKFKLLAAQVTQSVE